MPGAPDDNRASWLWPALGGASDRKGHEGLPTHEDRGLCRSGVIGSREPAGAFQEAWSRTTLTGISIEQFADGPFCATVSSSQQGCRTPPLGARPIATTNQ